LLQPLIVYNSADSAGELLRYDRFRRKLQTKRRMLRSTMHLQVEFVGSVSRTCAILGFHTISSAYPWDNYLFSAS